MEKLNYNKLLDLTLITLLNETDYSHIEYNLLFSKNDILNNLTNRDKFAIIEKLVNDGYANRFDDLNINHYYITIKGILFIDNGKKGYSQKSKKDYQLYIWTVIKNGILITGSFFAIILAYFEIKEKTQSKATLIECKDQSKEAQLILQKSHPQNNKPIKVQAHYQK